MDLTLVPKYACVLAMGMIFLSIRVIRLRRACKVAVGDGGQAVLERAIRVHGNFCEYVPVIIVLLLVLEFQGLQPALLQGLCLLLLAGRVAHAVGVSRTEEDYRFRVAGVAATMTVLATASLLILAGGILPAGLFG